MFALTLCLAHSTRHYSITASGNGGWEIRVEEDAKLRRLHYYRDWHRVERAMDLFGRETSALRASGWQVVEPQSMNR